MKNEYDIIGETIKEIENSKESPSVLVCFKNIKQLKCKHLKESNGKICNNVLMNYEGDLYTINIFLDILCKKCKKHTIIQSK